MDYGIIKPNLKEMVIGISLYFGICGIVAYFFYRSIVAFFIFSPGYFIFLKMYKDYLIEKRKKRLLDEFSESLMSASINMRSGYSIENAFLESYKDILLFYGDDSLMAAEILRIKQGLEVNLTLEELIEDLAKRSDEKEIMMFSDICKSAKRNGGNITEVLSETADRIRSGICTDREIDTILSEKKLELRIMETVPFLLMAYLEVTSDGYFDVLYEGIAGRSFMTGCLILYVMAVLLGKRILKIEV